MSQAEVITSAFNELLKNLKISVDSLVNISIETTKTKKGDEKIKISMSFPLQPSVTNSIGQEPSQPTVAPIQPEEDDFIIKKTEQYSSQHADIKKTMDQEKEKLDDSQQNLVNETLASNPSSDDDDIAGFYECPFCYRMFSYYYDLDVHMCNTCASNKDLLHLDQEHTMDLILLEDQITAEKHKQYACDFCDRRFTYAYIQETHMSKWCKKNRILDETVDKEKSHKSKEEESTAIVSGMRDTDKPFTCQVCRRHFNFKENMEFHMESHDSENRIGRSNLNENPAVQHGFQQTEEDPNEKKNKCFFCEERFATDAELLSHCLNHH